MFTDLCIFIRPVNCLVIFFDLLLRKEWMHGWAVRFLNACSMCSFVNISLYCYNLGDCYEGF